MKESLIVAKEELIKRWVAAFDEIGNFTQSGAQTMAVKYAKIFSYNLSNYKNGKIKAGSKLFNGPPGDKNTYGKYGFNKQGFLTTAEIYSKGELSNFGYFTKSESLIEYVEFSAETNLTSSIERIFFEKGKKKLFQSVFANGRRGFYPNKGYRSLYAISAAFDDGHSAVCTIEIYEYNGGQIIEAYGLSILPGIGERFYQNIYRYAGNKLLEIKTYNEDGQTSIAYIARSGRTLTEIGNELANLFCDYLISVLKKQHFDGPLFSVELSYRYCDNYHPHPVVITERKKNDAIGRKSNFVNEGEFIYANENIPTELTELYAEFYQALEAKDNWEAGRKMLIQTAKLMTASKLKGEIPVTEDFITFPIEWELEFEDLEKILLQCGASKLTVKKWKEYNSWL